jgi:hypothetical protein
LSSATAFAQDAQPQGRTRDSLKNGTIIGAIVGGVATASFGAWICNLLREPGNPPCWKSVATAGLFGAGIGAAAGAGIDALAASGPQPVMRPAVPSFQGIGFVWRHRF